MREAYVQLHERPRDLWPCSTFLKLDLVYNGDYCLITFSGELILQRVSTSVQTEHVQARDNQTLTEAVATEMRELSGE